MIIEPKFTYSGLTIILDNPSRFDVDRKSLLTGFAGDWFNTECLGPNTTRWACQIRTRDDKSPLLPGTLCILALGNRVLGIVVVSVIVVVINVPVVVVEG